MRYLLTGANGTPLVDAQGNALVDLSEFLSKLPGFGGWTKADALRLIGMSPSERIQFLQSNSRLEGVDVGALREELQLPEASRLKEEKRYEPPAELKSTLKPKPEMPPQTSKASLPAAASEIPLAAAPSSFTSPPALVKEAGVKPPLVTGASGTPLVDSQGKALADRSAFLSELPGHGGWTKADALRLIGMSPAERIRFAESKPKLEGVNPDVLRERHEKEQQKIKEEERAVEEDKLQEEKRYLDSYEQIRKLKERAQQSNLSPEYITKQTNAAEGNPIENARLRQEILRTAHRFGVDPSMMAQGTPIPPLEELKSTFKSKLGIPSQTRRSEDKSPASEVPFPPIDSSFTSTPRWNQELQRQVADKQSKFLNSPIKHYTGPRVAKLTPMQEVAAQYMGKELTENPNKEDFSSARSFLQKLGGDGSQETALENERQSILKDLGEDDIKRYEDTHYKNILDEIKENATDHFLTNVLPGIRGQLTAAGHFQGPHWQKRMDHEMKKFNDSLNRQLAMARSHVRDKAIQHALQAKQMAHSSLGMRSDFLERQRNSQKEAASGLQNIAANEAAQRQKAAALANAMGSEEQAMNQALLTEQHNIHKEQEYEPAYRAALVQSTLTNPGAAMSLGYAQQAPLQPQQNLPNMFGGTLVNAAANMLSNQNKRHGGRIHKAEGGSLTSQALSDIRKEFIDQSLNRAHQLETQETNPWWRGLATIGANVAASKNPRTLQAIGESLPAFQQSFDATIESNKMQKNQALNLREAILKTLERQEEQEFKRTMDSRKMDLDETYRNAQIKQWDKENAINWAKVNNAREATSIKNGPSTIDNKTGQGIDLTNLAPGVNPLTLDVKHIPTADERKLSLKLSSDESTIRSLQKDLARMKKLAPIASSVMGEYYGDKNSLFHSIPAAKANLLGGKSKKAYDAWQEFNALSEGIADKIADAKKTGNLALGRVNIIRESKPHGTKNLQPNLNLISKLSKEFDDARQMVKAAHKYKKYGLENVFGYMNQYIDSKNDESNPYQGTFEDFMEDTYGSGSSHKHLNSKASSIASDQDELNRLYAIKAQRGLK